MQTRRFVLAALLATGPAAALALPAAAANQIPFDAEAFRAAQAAGKSILVEVYAAWCPTCRRQRPVIESLVRKPEFRDFVVFTIDFDKQRDAMRALKATQQATLIVFKGATETGRSIGMTDPAYIEMLMADAI